MTRPDRNDAAVHRLKTPLLTLSEAAQLLAVKPSWIYEAVRAGTLPSLRIGRHIRCTRRTVAVRTSRLPVRLLRPTQRLTFLNRTVCGVPIPPVEIEVAA